MILKYFRSNQPAILLTLPVIAIVFWVPHFLSDEEAFIHRGFFAEWTEKYLNFNQLIFKMIACLCILVQAVHFNTIIQNTEVFSKLSHVPALIYVVLGSIFSFNGGLEPMLFTNFFLLLALQNVLVIYHQNSVIGLTLNIGFYLGMASVFEPACLVLIIPVFISILILRAADWREMFFLLIGALLPFLFLWTIYFVIGLPLDFPQGYFELKTEKQNVFESGAFISLTIIFVFILLLSLFRYFLSLRGIVLRIRKMRLVLFYFSIMAIVVYGYLYLTPFFPLQNQLLLIPVSVLVSFWLLQPARPVLTDFLFYTFLIVWGFFVYNLYFI